MDLVTRVARLDKPGCNGLLIAGEGSWTIGMASELEGALPNAAGFERLWLFFF